MHQRPYFESKHYWLIPKALGYKERVKCQTDQSVVSYLASAHVWVCVYAWVRAYVCVCVCDGAAAGWPRDVCLIFWPFKGSNGKEANLFQYGCNMLQLCSEGMGV